MTAAQVPATISDVKLVNAFFRGRRTPEQDEGSASPCDAGAMPTSRSNKDSVNLFIKNASRLTSIEEAPVEGYSTASSGSSGSSGQATNEGKTSSSESATLTPSQRQRQQLLQEQQQRDSKYPNIDFLENDVSLWDAFFLRSKTSGRFQSVLRPTAPPPPAPPPPLPVEEYLRYRPHSSRRVPIHDADSLRTLLPQAHKHLLTPTPTSTTTTATPSPVTAASQSMSKLQLRSGGDEKSVDTDIGGAKQKWAPPCVVREAWTSVDEMSSPSQPFVVRRRRPSRRSSSANSCEQRNLNALNNNDENSVDIDDDVDVDDIVAKRRSFHPQDFLSKLLTRSSQHSRKSDFPKVRVIYCYLPNSKILNSAIGILLQSKL